MSTWWPYARLLAAVIGMTAIVRQLALSVGNAIAADTAWGSHLPTVFTNFFSYFTVLANVSAAIVLTAGAVWTLRHRRTTEPEPVWLTTALVCVSTYMIITGLVYNLLLRQYPIAGISDVWTNETLHLILPLFLLADVLFAPRRRALPASTVLVVAAFPLLWAVYTLLRADFVIAPLLGTPYWYPYPFLNPHVVAGGFLGVAGYVLGIAAAIIAVAGAIVWIGRRRAAAGVSGESRLTAVES